MSDRKPAGHGPTAGREHFPKCKKEIGEDPARFLDRPIPQLPAEDEVVMAYDRIAGIDRLGIIGAWQAVEVELGRGGDDDEGRPRPYVRERINARRDELLEQGERPDREQLHAIAQAVREGHPEWRETAAVEVDSWETRIGIPSWERSSSEEETDEAVAPTGGDL